MKINQKVYHAGDFKNKSENLSVGLHGTSFCSGYFFTTHKEDCENQGAGFNLEYKRPVYSFSLSGLNLFPTTWQDCKTLNLFNKCLYYWPVYQAYYGDIDHVIYYEPVYNALEHCFEDFYADDVPDDERASKFLRELKDSYRIESEDTTEITGEDYSFLDYVKENHSLKELQKCVRRIESDAHNTFPYLTDLFVNGNIDNTTFDDLRDEINNFLDNYELAINIDSMLKKVAVLVKVDVEELIDIANSIASKYVNIYNRITGKFDNWSANKDDDLFATQLLLYLNYQGTYPMDDSCDSTEWGGTVFHKEDLQNIQREI